MHRKYLVGALVACACFFAGGLRANDQETMESKILARIHQGNQMEIQLGERAKAVAQSGEVRNFGDRLVTEHRKAEEDLFRLVELNKIRLSAVIPESSEEAQQMAEEMETTGRLLTLSGENFDREFLKAAIRCHERAIRKLNESIPAMAQGEIRKWVEAQVPGFQSHLDEARRLLKSLPEVNPTLPSNPEVGPKSPKQPAPQLPSLPETSPKLPTTPTVPQQPVTSPKLPTTPTMPQQPVTSPKLPTTPTVPQQPVTSPKLPTLPSQPVTSPKVPTRPTVPSAPLLPGEINSPKGPSTPTVPQQPVTSPKAPQLPPFSPKQPAPQNPEQFAQPQQPLPQQPLPQQPLPQQPKAQQPLPQQPGAQQPMPIPGTTPQQPSLPEVPLQP